MEISELEMLHVCRIRVDGIIQDYSKSITKTFTHYLFILLNGLRLCQVLGNVTEIL